MATTHRLVWLRDKCLFLLFVEKFPRLLTAAWARQAGWDGRAHELALPGEKVSEVGKGLLLDSMADPVT